MSSPSFRGIVREAFVNVLRHAEDPKEYPDRLAEEIRALMRRDGYAVHALDRCVSLPPWARNPGRPMTDYEARLVGLMPVETGTGAEPESPTPAEGDPENRVREDRTVSAEAEGRGS